MIDYGKIAKAVEFYSKHMGYTRVEAPWWVSEEIVNITKPGDAFGNYFIPENRKCLVASGEQSFLYMANKGRLPAGKYITVTPCFRNESIGLLSKKCFIKAELINTQKVDRATLDDMIGEAHDFLVHVVPNHKLIKLVQTSDDSYDLEYDGIEVGSYGIRRREFLEWVYGTGCAEPRLTRAIKMSENAKQG